MTIEEKREWLRNATNEELIRQLESLTAEETRHCSFGRGQEDINLTREEILRRMSK